MVVFVTHDHTSTIFDTFVNSAVCDDISSERLPGASLRVGAGGRREAEREGAAQKEAFRPEQSEIRLLVARVLRGEQQAFGEIVDKYGALMLRTAIMIVEDRDVAEDVVQDAFIQAWQHLPDLREADALRSWLMRIVVNQCISFKRRLARTTAFMRQALSEQEIDLAAQLADHYKGRLERDWDLARAIENLPLKQRVVIVLHYYNGMTLPEMSSMLKTSENTLKKRIQAALVNLRRCAFFQAPSWESSSDSNSARLAG